jgi:hypothetical protein
MVPSKIVSDSTAGDLTFAWSFASFERRLLNASLSAELKTRIDPDRLVDAALAMS